MAILGEYMDFDQPEQSNFSHRSGNSTVFEINWEEPLKVEIDHFFDCIMDGVTCITGVDHAKKVVAILEKASADCIIFSKCHGPGVVVVASVP